jgi:protein-tyrosine phosphatase
MIDLHCHILPGLDDGSQDLEESLAMAAMAVKDGVETIVATPHTLNGLYMNSREDILEGVEELTLALAARRIKLRILPGADVHLAPGLAQKLRAGEAVTVNDTGKYVLLELPPQIIPGKIKDEIFALHLNGITPIITHPERHPAVQRDLDSLQELISMGALCQVTAMSVTGEFGMPVMTCTHAMLARRLVHVIASDAHSIKSRPPLLWRAVEAAGDVLGNDDEAEDMVTRIPAAIISGKAIG